MYCAGPQRHARLQKYFHSQTDVREISSSVPKTVPVAKNIYQIRLHPSVPTFFPGSPREPAFSLLSEKPPCGSSSCHRPARPPEPAHVGNVPDVPFPCALGSPHLAGSVPVPPAQPHATQFPVQHVRSPELTEPISDREWTCTGHPDGKDPHPPVHATAEQHQPCAPALPHKREDNPQMNRNFSE